VPDLQHPEQDDSKKHCTAQMVCDGEWPLEKPTRRKKMGLCDSKKARGEARKAAKLATPKS
jgi:hypothetical protein